MENKRSLRIIDLDPNNRTAIEQAAAVLVAGFKQHNSKSWPDMAAGLEEINDALAPEKIVRIALNAQDQIVGWVGALPEYNGNVWELHPLVVHPDYQGLGVGRALVADLEKILRDRDAKTLMLGSDDEDDQTSLSGKDLYPDVLEHATKIRNVNRHPYEFYQKVGFVIVGVIPDANGFGKPDIIMAKRICR
jgi:aminoglycoside 6'-N-acetyltransferase I